ncbi:MAG TPA: hypothetical protein VMF91_23990 [Bryobacteraceae bacterium]|nr:hypothetical protein [Bryobacteraceae bacterium]
MESFPVLSSGAVTQYPAQIASGQGAQVIRFLDASDQRYLVQPRALRQWQIRLDLLNEGEIQGLEAFFVAQSGDYSPFSFPDPFSGATVPNCRLAAPGLVTEYVGVDVSSTSFWVIETNG